MREYRRQDDWKIICNVKIELTKRWVDVAKLKIFCTRGVVEIEGSLEFTGQGKSAMDSTQTIANALKKYDAALRSISMVRDIKWRLVGWEIRGRMWSYHPTAEIKKRDEAKGLKKQ